MASGNIFLFCFLDSTASLLIATAIFALVLSRIIFVMCHSGKQLSENPQHMRTLIILGSGGHTAEMLSLLALLLSRRFNPRFYIAAATDNMSLEKARLLEDSLVSKGRDENKVTARYMQIYRSREVGQLYITSIGTTLVAVFHAFWLMLKIRPQVIICNGPGTCIPICLIAFFFKIVWIEQCSILYVESIARVRKLSLSGLILYKLRIADLFFVQWPQLQTLYPRSHYVGCLM